MISTSPLLDSSRASLVIFSRRDTCLPTGRIGFFDFLTSPWGDFGEGISETCFLDLAGSQKTFFEKCLLTVERDGKRFADEIFFVKSGTY